MNCVSIDGTINPAVVEFVRESIYASHQDGARALVIQLDTPGGLLSSTRAIVKDILSAPLPVIVYVAPSGASAGSAGVFMALAAHVAARGKKSNKVLLPFPIRRTAHRTYGSIRTPTPDVA